MLRFVTLLSAALLSSPAVAYIGPGAGISVLGSLLGIIVTIVVAIGAIIMWPLRKALKKRRQNTVDLSGDATPPEALLEDRDTGQGKND